MRLLALVGAIVLTVQAPLRANAQSGDETSANDVSQRTRALFRRGLAAYNSGHVETARQLFLQAWALRRSADVAMELAQTEIDLGRYVDAARHLEYAQRNFTPSINEKMRSIARRAHEEALRHVAQLAVAINVDGAEVLLNGVVVGKSPLAESLYTAPGNCVLQARFGSATVSKSVTAEAGNSLTVALTLASPTNALNDSSPSSESPSDEQPSTHDDERRRSLVPVVIGGALTAVGISAGVGLRIASHSAEDDALTLSASLGAQGCIGPSANAAVCASLRHALEKSDRERNWSTASFIFASAALVGTATYWFWPQRKHSRGQSGASISGVLTPDAGGLTVTGTF